MTNSVPPTASAIGLVAILAAGGVAAQGRPGLMEPSVIFHVPANVDPAGVTIGYLLRDTWGLSSSIEGRQGLRDYVLLTTYEGRAAKSLVAYAYAPGFGFTLAKTDLATQGPPIGIDLPFRPLGTIPLEGRVEAADEISLTGLFVGLRYYPDWYCEFFGMIDCLIGSIEIGESPVSADGSFRLDVPDFARDPALVPFTSKGSFSLALVAPPSRRMNPIALSVPASMSSRPRSDGLPREFGVAESYPAGQRYRTVPR